MLPIFEKLEAIAVEVSSLLNDSDKAACESLFEKYQAHINFWYPRLQAFATEHELYREDIENDDEDPYHSICDNDKITYEWKNIVNNLTEQFIRLVEDYFTETYSLKFNPYKPFTRNRNPIALTGYEPIITNMIDQVGADLLHSGKKQIKNNFQKYFAFERHQPELKGKKIMLPGYSGIEITHKGEYHLPWSEDRVYTLLQAAALFLHDSVNITEELLTWYDQWKTQIICNFSYELTGFSLRFFSNKRIDLSFKDAGTAQRFLDAYELQTIAAQNRLND
ncbi:MAG TPA: hypothetical protein PLS00_00155 [Niabella sp.]|nr:hypothetical protein [Niabella sp.]